MTSSDALMILAVLVAPLAAVQVQKWLEHYREERERQLRIFKTLMATRAITLSQEHVQALNMIDLEFCGKKYKKITTSWKEYLDHLGDFPKDDEKQLPVWNDKKADLLANLLMIMGQSLGYEFDAVHVKKGIYMPQGHADIEDENILIRKGLIRLLYGDSNIKMDVQSFPVDPEAFEKQKTFVQGFIDLLSSKSTLPVSVFEKKREEKQA